MIAEIPRYGGSCFGANFRVLKGHDFAHLTLKAGISRNLYLGGGDYRTVDPGFEKCYLPTIQYINSKCDENVMTKVG